MPPTDALLPPELVDAAERSAAPSAVRAALARLVEGDAARAERLGDGSVGPTAVAVLAASRWLARLIEREPDAALDRLADLDVLEACDDDTPEALAAWKERERLAARDLTGLDDLAATGAGLASLAGDVLRAGCRMADADGLAVIGMGKLGGHELNYSSDIDVVFVGAGPLDRATKAARRVMAIAGLAYRVDPDLRPEGRDGALVRTLESYEAYWARWAEPWERQAMLKAVPVAGFDELGGDFHARAQAWLWGDPFDADAIREVRAMKARTEASVARRGGGDRELKRGPGGIRDIEFTVQLLQLVHGHADQSLRSPTTLDALDELARAGYVDGADATVLADAYRYLRRVEHRLQLVEGQQVHTMPTDAASLDHLARTLGRRDSGEASAAETVEREVRRSQLAVRSIHERIYFRPLLEAFSGVGGPLTPDAAAARLEAFGFTDARRTEAAVRELTRGLNRTSRLMQQMLPLLLDWLSTSPDPELGLVVLRNLLTGSAKRTSVLVETFREAPDAARCLCHLVGTSRMVGDVLGHHPDLVARLPHPDRLRTETRDALVASAATALGWRTDPDDRQDALRRWKDRNLVGIAARDLLGYETDVDVIGRDLTALAEATIDAALGALEPAVPFAVLALGRLGGAELSYASDLDLVFVHDADDATGVEEAQRLATRLVRALGGATPARRLYDVDTDLRPEGRQGAMVRSVAAFARYWEGHAQTWERQAMLRARPVAGDLGLGQAVLTTVAPHVWAGGLSAEDELAIRRLKARMEHERLPAGEDPDFHLKLGRGSLSDVEWTVQLLQLRHGVAATGTWPALASLEAGGALEPDDADALRAAYRFCERTRNRLYLVRSAPGDALPTQPEQLRWLARSLGTTSVELREEYRRVTRRARWVVERIFYGEA